MARIRTIKPDFFRHELLQDLEQAHPELHPMLVFAGLFGHCDREGRFAWRPKQLKLDILPFIAFDLAESMAVLEQASQVVKYEVEGRQYGWIPSFREHQRISGAELKAPAKYPEPPREVLEKHKRSTRETFLPVGREGNGIKEGKGTDCAQERAAVDKSTGTAKTTGQWWLNNESILAKANSLGISTRGESTEALKAQIRERLEQLNHKTEKAA